MDQTNGGAKLSPREREIARAYAGGASYRDIAEQLFIAPTTVRTHLSTIYRKLGVSSKIGLLRMLERTGSDPEHVRPQDSRAAAQKPASAPAGKRQVVVLSAMLDHLTEITDRLDPEATAELLGHFRRVVEEEVERQGGWSLGGRPADLTACFGLLTAQETDAERAVQCSLEISMRLAAGTGPNIPPMRARIGLYTGPVITTGSDAGAEALAGAAPDLAAALAREATDGGIVVCGRTRAMLGDLFAFSEIGPIPVEGKSDTKRSFAVTGRRRSETRFEALHGYRLTPIVGRKHEIGLLEDLFERACDGSGHVALVIGEAGIGKSRTVKAFCDHLSLGPEQMLVFQCSPHETASPLHPVARALRNAADVERHDTAEGRLEAMLSLFADVLGDSVEGRELLSDFASIPYAVPSGHEPISPQKRRERTLELLDRFVRSRAEPGPVLLIFEDMHWADPTTVTWFERIAGMTESLPVLAVATFRPEIERGSAAGPNVTSLSLARLTRRETVQIVASQAGARTLPAATVARIVERSEGIPLFAEELTRSILERGETEDAIPATLQASLMGRLDRLGAAREAAQAAAVIGRDFNRALLAEILPHGRRVLDRALEALLASHLVLRRGRGEAEELQFKHALVRDAAYDSLLRPQREALHRKLAEALLTRREAGRDVAPELIANHLAEGAARARSVSFWTEAARTALQKGAEREASQFCRSGLAHVETIEDVEAQHIARFDLLALQYGADYCLGDVDHLLTIVDDEEKYARLVDDPVRLSKALDSKTYVLASAGRLTEAIDAGRQAVDISAGLDDDYAFIGANMMLSRALYAAGEYREAIGYATKVRDLLGTDLERGYIAGAMNQTQSSRSWLTCMQSEIGAFDEAERSIAETMEMLPRLRAAEHDTLWATLAFGRLRWLRGDDQSVIEMLDPQLEICRREYPVYLPRMAMSLGPALVSEGNPDRGIALLEEADELGRVKKFLFLRALLLAQFAHALLSIGEPTRAADTARRAMVVAEEAGEAGNLAWAQLSAAQAALAMGRTEDARKFVEIAAEAARARGMAPLLQRCDTPLDGIG